MQVTHDVMVPMRDGAALATDVYRPDGNAAAPALLQRVPYGKVGGGAQLDEITAFVRAGYAVAIQDCRGRFGSEGRFEPFAAEADDGHDAIAWVAAQPWCDGTVGMIGGSYTGATQWLAAGTSPPALRAIAPVVTTDDYYEGWTYQGGAFQLGFALSWTLRYLALPELRRRVERGDARPEELDALIGTIDTIDGRYATRPLVAAPIPPGLADYYRRWLAHPADGPYWQATAPRERHRDIAVPSLNIAGWYDCFLGGTLANYRGMRRSGAGEAARRPRLIVGPWAHSAFTGHYAEAAFGLRSDAAEVSLVAHQLRFFDRHLRGLDNGLDDEPPVKLFVMGAGVWRDEADWPLPDTRYRRFYLRSGGHAATADGDGWLSPDPPPAGEPADVFRYDPRDPVPTVGGQTCLPGMAVAANAGPRDQRAVEARPDVLCYTSPVLERDTEVTGPITLVVWLSSSARDTDVTGKLVDVHPDGRAVILTDGILRARYRDSRTTPSLLEPGAAYLLEIDLQATANVFRAGHRIRLEVSSSSFPRFDPNTNSGGELAQDGDADIVVAENTIHHDARHPSHLVLPLIERGAGSIPRR